MLNSLKKINMREYCLANRSHFCWHEYIRFNVLSATGADKKFDRLPNIDFIFQSLPQAKTIDAFDGNIIVEIVPEIIFASLGFLGTIDPCEFLLLSLQCIGHLFVCIESFDSFIVWCSSLALLEFTIFFWKCIHVIEETTSSTFY